MYLENRKPSHRARRERASTKGIIMKYIEAEEMRRRIEADFEEMGIEFGMDGRCIANYHETGAVFETDEGYQHIFTFPPTVGDEERF
jgi:hypothetical protein